MKTDLELADRLSKKGHGLDIQYRREGTNWPKPWRLKMIYTKNERDHLRVCVFGDSLDAALRAADEALQQEQQQGERLTTGAGT